MTAEEELIKSIKKKLTSGYPEGELKNELLESGHKQEDIEKWFFIASGHADKPTKATVEQNSNAAIFKLIAVALLITGITILGTSLWIGEYGIYLLIASAVCFVIGYSISNSNNRNKNP